MNQTRGYNGLAEAVKLLQLSELIAISTKAIIKEWSNGPTSEDTTLPSRELYELQRTLISAAGMVTELVQDPAMRLLEVSNQYFEARALFIAAEKRIPDILSEAGGNGLSVDDLGLKIGIESRKLSRVMRTLCSIHIFREVAQDVFTNNTVSQALISNEPLRAYILLFGLDLYSASDHLPKTLSHSKKGPSYDVSVTPWQDAIGTTKTRWEWLGEKTTIAEVKSQPLGYPGSITPPPGDDDNTIARPELDIFGLAMVGGGQVFGAAHIYDYPWESLGEAKVVDVGGGVGGFCMQLSSIYPKLKFVVQDREEFLNQGRNEVWAQGAPEALKSGRVEFIPHDFFLPNPVKNAEIYWLRYILHDWSDEYCVEILSAIRPSMSPNSRILVCDQVMNTTIGCEELSKAPSPLPANYGYYTRYSHQRDLAMMSIINGIERTPAQFRDIIERAGLKMTKIWECRSQVSLVEISL